MIIYADRQRIASGLTGQYYLSGREICVPRDGSDRPNTNSKIKGETYEIQEQMVLVSQSGFTHLQLDRYGIRDTNI
ncbi:hypothetical protein TAO_1743 [Candidatus Nitrosoglobus terrae]|uniref:Uncharacterized protein n=1 Tax=Candidatus Nitrosoglobus terrae TaxID=1630141 RepID=A0A1Q2SPS6_9GAMM|nr:hypothetical protein TAO_1743 [Candidatus Nitrosoglobus terrae]